MHILFFLLFVSFHFRVDNNNDQKHESKKKWTEKPRRFVTKDFRKDLTDYIEALAYATFCTTLSTKSLEPINLDSSNNVNSVHIIFDLQLTWDNNMHKYVYEKFELFTSGEDINNILQNCYELKDSKDFVNLIRHYAIVGEQNHEYIMINGWIHKVILRTLYVFLVGKRLSTESTESADEIRTVIEEHHNKYTYSEIKQGISREDNPDLNPWAEYALYFKNTLQGIYTNSNIKPNKEAWFTTYFLATVLSESIRNFRSFPVTLMALDLSKDPEILSKLPMTKGGTWINPDKRGFYGAYTAVKKRPKKKLKNLIIAEEEICIKWLEHSKETEIDEIMICRLLEVLYGRHRLSTEPLILQTFIKRYNHFIEVINSPITPSNHSSHN